MVRLTVSGGYGIGSTGGLVLGDDKTSGEPWVWEADIVRWRSPESRWSQSRIGVTALRSAFPS